MIYEWVKESVNNSLSELFAIFLWKWKCRNYFVVKCLFHILSDYRILHRILYVIIAGKEWSQYKWCMRTVKDSNLSFLIWMMILCKYYIKTSFFKWKLFFKLFKWKIWITLYNPETEYFSSVDKLIFISPFFAKLSCIFSWVTRNNSINKCWAEWTIFVNPVFETIFKTPKFDKLHDALL